MATDSNTQSSRSSSKKLVCGGWSLWKEEKFKTKTRLENNKLKCSRVGLGESSFISCQLCAKHLPVLKWNGLLYSSLSCLTALCTAKACQSQCKVSLTLCILLPQLWETPLGSCDTQQTQQFMLHKTLYPVSPHPQNHFFQRDDAEHVDIKFSMLVNSKELEYRRVYLFLTIMTESLILIHVKM